MYMCMCMCMYMYMYLSQNGPDMFCYMRAHRAEEEGLDLWERK